MLCPLKKKKKKKKKKKEKKNKERVWGQTSHQIIFCLTGLYLLFYMVFHNHADSVEANCLLAIIKSLFYNLWQQRTARVCMLCIWLHLRNDLELQCIVDIWVMLLLS